LNGWITIYDIIAFVGISLALFTLLVLIPSRKRVLAGEAGRSMKSALVPVLLIVESIIGVAVLVLSLLSELQVRAFISGLFLIIAVAFIWFEFFKVRSLMRERPPELVTAEVATIAQPSQHQLPVGSNNPNPGQVAPGPEQGVLPRSQQASLPQAPAAVADTMKVECPGCGGHIEIPLGSHQITCPYCGLSGTL